MKKKNVALKIITEEDSSNKTIFDQFFFFFLWGEKKLNKCLLREENGLQKKIKNTNLKDKPKRGGDKCKYLDNVGEIGEKLNTYLLWGPEKWACFKYLKETREILILYMVMVPLPSLLCFCWRPGSICFSLLFIYFLPLYQFKL